MKVSLETDFSSFKYGVIQVTAHVKRASAKGVDKAMQSLKHDCLEKAPKCPVDTGYLASQHNIKPVKVVDKSFIGELRVETPYAASLHEGISRHGSPYKFKKPGTGAKWVETKLIDPSKYIRIAANELPK